jgi:GAF domain-containing protein/CheY-like chemotaxis protein
VAACVALTHFPARAQTQLSLSELGKRKSADFSPLHVGQKVAVRGIVALPAFHFPQYTLLAIEDGRAGAVLKLPSTDVLLDQLSPGDEIDVQGEVVAQNGMAMLTPENVDIRGKKPLPVPADMSIAQMQRGNTLGRLARVEGVVREATYNAGGALVILRGTNDAFKFFIPQTPGHEKANLAGIREGDRVRATGIALQYCPQPPYNSGYELLVANMNQLAVVGRAGTLSLPLVLGGIVALLLVGLLLWTRERRMTGQRQKLRKTYQLGEEILGASSAATILKRISEALPAILGVTRVQLYVYNRSAKTLDSVVDERSTPVSISLSSPPGGTPAGAVACFHYRTLLVIPDVDRSPFPIAGSPGEKTPKSLLFVPMTAQNEVVGVLELDQDDQARDFSADEGALAQHLGNQIGVALRLLDQRSVQEHLFRTEKLAAIGRLISGVVNELQAPLASIKELAHKALDKAHGGPAEREVTAIAAEAAKASGIVSRLVSFAAAEPSEAKPVNVPGLLRALIEFREGDWKASGIKVKDLTSPDPMLVVGSHGQLEQVFLNLLVHAEQSLAKAENKTITVRTSLLARRVLVEISFTPPPEARKPEETAAVLGVTRSVIAGHGGEVRLIEKANSDPRFEVELPAAMKERVAPGPAATAPVRDSARRMTALVIEHEEAAQRQVLALLSARGFRVVPVSNSDTGLDMAQRMRFDAVFCSLHAPGLNWVELSERLHSRVGGFILLSDGYDAELSADFEGDGQFVLPKPVQEEELDRVLRLLEPRGATIIPFKTGTA